MIRDALLSSCGQYRFTLLRSDNDASEGAAIVAWVMHNPSTADAHTDDNTIKKCWRFTRAWGNYCMIVVNVNPFRSTDPKAVVLPPEVILSLNDAWLQSTHQASVLTVCAWGNDADPALVKRTVDLLYPMGPLYALRTTKKGQPSHPLYLPETLRPVPWKPTCFH